MFCPNSVVLNECLYFRFCSSFLVISAILHLLFYAIDFFSGKVCLICTYEGNEVLISVEDSIQIDT